MVTPDEMPRCPLADGLRWPDQTDNPSHRDLMIRVAKQLDKYGRSHRAASFNG